jgi:hypothetical protein
MRCAVSFIRTLNASSLPLTCFASMMAASLPEGRNKPYRRSSTVTCIPGSRPMTEDRLRCFSSFALTSDVTTASRFTRSIAASAVMIFVRLAGATEACGSLPNSKAPHSASRMATDVAGISNGGATGVGVGGSASVGRGGGVAVASGTWDGVMLGATAAGTAA